jgi:hypothetical protein
MRKRRGQSGQSVAETTILAPLFLAVAFGLIQIGHVGITVALVSYGASAIARMAVQENGYNEGHAQQRLNQLLAAGMSSAGVANRQDNTDPLTPNITVTACAKLPAYPFVGPLLQSFFQGASAEGGCFLGAPLVSLVSSSGYHFIIRGQATARMNYTPPGSGG